MPRYFGTADHPTRPVPRSDLAEIPATMADVSKILARIQARDQLVDQLVKRIVELERQLSSHPHPDRAGSRAADLPNIRKS